MGVKKEWHGPEQKAAIEAEMIRRLVACALLLQGHAKRLVSTAGTGTGRGKGGRFQRTYGANPSAPGEPPRKQTGRLRASITWERMGRSVRVGTNLLYGLWLELGTARMAARPWLRRSLAECADRIRAILSKPMN